MKQGPSKLIIVHSLKEVPEFTTEDEEREWWTSHELSERFYERLEDVTDELDRQFPIVPKTAKQRGAR